MHKEVFFHTGYEKWGVYFSKSIRGQEYSVCFMAKSEDDAHHNLRYEKLAHTAFRRAWLWYVCPFGKEITGLSNLLWKFRLRWGLVPK